MESALQEHREAAAAAAAPPAEERAAESKLLAQYKAVLHVQEAAGGASSGSSSGAALRLSLFGSNGETGVQRLDGSHATPGKPLVCLFEGPDVGHLQRLRIGLAASSTTAEEGGGHCTSSGQQCTGGGGRGRPEAGGYTLLLRRQPCPDTCAFSMRWRQGQGRSARQVDAACPA